jgi:hypothetical protein
MRRLAFVATTGALALLAGCGFGTKDAPAETDLASARKPDISCLGDVEVVHKDRYDLNGDGRAELFLIMRCKSKTDPRGAGTTHGQPGPRLSLNARRRRRP